MKQNINKSQGYRKHQSILYILRGVGNISMFFPLLQRIVSVGPKKRIQCWKKVKRVTLITVVVLRKHYEKFTYTTCKFTRTQSIKKYYHKITRA